METVKKEKMRSGILLAALMIGSLAVFAIFGHGIYGDSEQYMTMHIHREPLYPLFLAILRAVFGNAWTIAMGIIQNILAAFSIWLFAEYVTKKFSLCFWQKSIIVGLELLPYVITPLVSHMRIILTNAVLSEGLSMPFFVFFIIMTLEMVSLEDKKAVRRAAGWSLFWSFLLALTRGQMMFTILMWMVVLGGKILLQKVEWRKKALRLVAIVIVVGLAFALRSLSVKSYNMVVHGHFINNTNGTVHMLANILYSADREDGERIADGTAREMFYYMYDLTEKYQANYKYAGDTWTEKVEHIEKWHNTINFDMIEAPMRQYFRETVSEDYIIQDLYSDEMAKQIIVGILPVCFGQWLSNYLLLSGYGLIRSIATVHPVINWIVGLLYVFAILLILYSMRRNWKNKEVRLAGGFMGIVMLAIFANAFAVSIIIMPISRYMIYGFPLFYTALFVLWIVTFRAQSKGKSESTNVEVQK